MHAIHETVRPAEIQEPSIPPIVGQMKDMAITVARSFDFTGPVLVVVKEPQNFRFIVAVGKISPGEGNRSIVFPDVFETTQKMTGQQVVATLAGLSQSEVPIICDKNTTEEVIERDRSIEFQEDDQHGLMGRQGRKYYVFADFAA